MNSKDQIEIDSTKQRNLQTWNKQSLLNRLKGRKDRVSILIEIYNEAMQNRLETLEHAVEQSDTEKLFAVAHAIKGVASNVSGEKLYEIASMIEACARNSDLETLRRLANQLKCRHIELSREFSRFEHET